MQKNPLPVLAVLAGCLFFQEADAQKFIGLASQYNGGFYAAYQNPAFLADNRFATQLHLLSGGVHLDNNYVRYAAPFSIFDLLRQKNDRPLYPYDLEEIRNGDPKNGTLSGELRGPAVSFRLGNKTNLAVMSRVRSGLQVTDASEQLMSIARLGLANAQNLQELGILALFASQSENKFNLTSQAYSEWAASLGQVLSENDAVRIKGGFTIKRYFGYAGGYVDNQELNYRVLPDPATANGALMQVDRFTATMGYTDASRDSFLSPGWLFGQNSSGDGWGWDAGLVVELLDEDSQTPRVRLSASVTDIGLIKYQGEKVKNYQIEAQNRQITEDEWRDYTSPREGENNLNAFGRVLEREFDLTEEDNTGEFSIATPSALNLSADLRLLEKVFVNATVIQGIARTATPQLQQTGLWAVTPRFESEQFGLAFPVIRQNGGWAVGAGLRAGPFVLGSDNLLGVFSRDGRFKAQGVDLYGGLSIALNKKNDSRR